MSPSWNTSGDAPVAKMASRNGPFAWLISQGKATRSDAAVLKLYTAETYKAVSDMGLQILGGMGYCMEYPMQRFFRDSRLAVLGGGTSEIQRNIIARGLGL